MKKKTFAIAVAVTCALLIVPAFAFADVVSQNLWGDGGNAQGEFAQTGQSANAQDSAKSSTGETINGNVACNPDIAGDSACPHYIDADGDGVCDNCRGYGRSGYTDADGDGVCDNCRGFDCPGFTDSDGDGVCDNCRGRGLYGQCGKGWGACSEHGHGNGCGQGCGYGQGHGCMRG